VTIAGRARIHASCVALASGPDGPLSGVLLLGPSGAGKSDLALRLIDSCPFGRTRLVADDYVDLTATPEGLRASPPPQIEGLIEVRGVGLVPTAWTPSAMLAAAFEITGPGPRLPAPRVFRPQDPPDAQAVPLFSIAPFEASAAAKTRAAVAAVLGGHLRHNDDD